MYGTFPGADYAALSNQCPAVRFLFWNIQRKALTKSLAALADEWKPDVIALAECTLSTAELLEAASTGGHGPFFIARDPATPKGKRVSRLRVCARLGKSALHVVTSSADGLLAIRVVPPLGQDFLLVVAHLAAKNHQTEVSQSLAVTRISRLIEKAESVVAHRRTVLVGDLNMNPFEPGVVAADGLHAVMSRAEASRGSRVVSEMERPFFYNPMWNLFGDATPGPSGTYFYGNSEQVCFFWNIFDQLLVRPELLNVFADSEVRVLTSAGQSSLTDGSGRPDARIASDHFPLLFDIHIERLGIAQ